MAQDRATVAMAIVAAKEAARWVQAAAALRVASQVVAAVMAMAVVAERFVASLATQYCKQPTQ